MIKLQHFAWSRFPTVAGQYLCLRQSFSERMWHRTSTRRNQSRGHDTILKYKTKPQKFPYGVKLLYASHTSCRLSITQTIHPKTFRASFFHEPSPRQPFPETARSNLTTFQKFYDNYIQEYRPQYRSKNDTPESYHTWFIVAIVAIVGISWLRPTLSQMVLVLRRRIR